MIRISGMVRLSGPAAVLMLSAFVASAGYAQTQSPAAAPAPTAPAAGGPCFDITEHVYGPYTMSFCLGNPGTYKVSGNGMTCNGILTTGTAADNSLDVRLHHVSCGGGKAWGAGQLSCRGANMAARGGMMGGPGMMYSSRAMVSSGIPVLHCTYTPAATSLKPETVRARLAS